MSQNLQLLFASPTIPRTFLKPEPGMSGIYAFYMKVRWLLKHGLYVFLLIVINLQIIRHELLMSCLWAASV